MKRGIKIFFVILAVAALGGAAYKLVSFKEVQRKGFSTSLSKNDVGLVTEIQKQIELPNDEVPTMATVTDLDSLKDKAFFQKAQLGDRVLVYTKYNKAILYRENSGQIIEFGPLNK
jgi:hypothetical protein